MEKRCRFFDELLLFSLNRKVEREFNFPNGGEVDCFASVCSLFSAFAFFVFVLFSKPAKIPIERLNMLSFGVLRPPTVKML